MQNIQRKPYAARNLAEVIESVLGVPFSKNHIDAYTPTPMILHDLALAVRAFYENYELPEKKDSELRPYIFPDFYNSQEFGIHYEFSPKHNYDNPPYKFDPSVSGELTRSVKKHLLYSHSIAIYDPLVYLLDYFELDPNSKYATARLPAVKALLGELSELEDLIRKNILILLTTEIVGLNTGQYLSEDEERFLLNKLPSLCQTPQDTEVAIKMVGGTILEELSKVHSLSSRIDLFFPTVDYVIVFKELLHYWQEQFTSADVREPFDAALVGTLSAINPDMISLDDIIRIRENDELFLEFRSTLEHVFERLYLNRDDFTDLQKQFVVTVQDELISWDDKLKSKARESSFIKKIIDSGDKMAIGVISGAISGALAGLATAGPPGSLVGALAGGGIGGIAQPGVETVRDLLRVARDRKAILSLRHHFLALGAHQG